MNTHHLRCLVALADEGDHGRAARACEVSPAELLQAVDAIEAEFGLLIVKAFFPFEGFTAQGQQVLAWARRQLAEGDQLQDDLQALKNDAGEAALKQLFERRSVSPKRLRAPGPDSQGIELIIQAALRSPDHGGLHPWRVIEFRDEQRSELADRFEQEKLRRDPLASGADRQRARAHATRAPVLLGFVVSPRGRGRIPVREQWLAAGAALGNLLNATHQLGFGAIVLSGDRCFDPVLSAQLGIKDNEYLAGFISIGSVVEVPPARRHVLPGEVWSCWLPSASPAAVAAPDGDIAAAGPEFSP